jgi:hypothetical protein
VVWHQEVWRRVVVLGLLAFGMVLFAFSAKDLWQVQLKDYTQSYQNKVRWGWINPQTTSLQNYIERELKGREVITVADDAQSFFSAIVQQDARIREHRSRYVLSHDYYFSGEDLPASVLSKGQSALLWQDTAGTSYYFRLYQANSSHLLRDAPYGLHYPWRNYAYLIVLLAILAYWLLPKSKIPEGAATYARLNAVYLPDLLAFGWWLLGWGLFCFMGDDVPAGVRYVILVFFGVFSLVMLGFISQYAARWYRFSDGALHYADLRGDHAIALDEIIAVKPYERRLPR